MAGLAAGLAELALLSAELAAELALLSAELAAGSGLAAGLELALALLE